VQISGFDQLFIDRNRSA